MIDDDDGFYVTDANQLVTEDDTPIGNFASEQKQDKILGYVGATKMELFYQLEMKALLMLNEKLQN